MTDLVYDNWGNVIEIDCLFEELPVRYELKTSTGTYLIEEPVKWDGVTIVHKRDRDYHGFNYEFMGEENELQFSTDSGLDEIEEEYATNGNDGECVLKKYLTYNNNDIVLFEGRLNLNTRKKKDYMVSCVVERKSLHQQIGSRLDSKLDFKTWKDLDDKDITFKTTEYILLKSRVLQETFRSRKDVLEDIEPYTQPKPRTGELWLFYNTSAPDVNTIKGYNGTILGISGDYARTYDNCIFKFQAAGEYIVNIDLSFKTAVEIKPPFLGRGMDISQYYVWTKLVHWRGNWEGPEDPTPQTDFILAEYELHPEIHETNETRQFETDVINGSIQDLSIAVEEGDRLSLFSYLVYMVDTSRQPKTTNSWLTQYECNVSLTGASVQEPSFHRSMRIKTVLESALERLTGQADILKSSYYSVQGPDQLIDGCGAKRVLVPGIELRKSESGTTNFGLTTSLKDCLTSLQAIDCIGMGYEWDAENEKETIRIEPVDYFFQDHEVLELPEVFDYQEETARDLIYNSVEVGYEKYNEDEINSMDEAHAFHEYQTPIKTEFNKYTAKSKWLASGYLIEITRRQSLSQDENQATSYDDDVFIIDALGDLVPAGDVYLFGPRTIEPFSEVAGTLSPETTYNMLITPKRMLFAHSKWLMSSLIYKGGSSVIKNTFTKQNKTLTTTLDPGFQCKNGDELGLPLLESADVILSSYGDFTGIYSPEWVNFKTRLTRNQIRYIINCHRGLSEDGNNYGYLTFKDDNGNTCKGWLYEMSYNQVTEEVSMRLLKKKFP